MDYYEEWIGSPEGAILLMREVRARTPKFNKVSFSQRMRLIRELLKEKDVIGASEIPFTVAYRRNR